MAGESLDDLLDRVNSADSLLVFASALAKDHQDAILAERDDPSSPYGPDAGGWENASIEAFLEAATGWAKDTDFGHTPGLRPENPWKQFAAFLYAGKIYE